MSGLVVVGVDGRRSSQDAVVWAARAAAARDAELRIVHAVGYAAIAAWSADMGETLERAGEMLLAEEAERARAAAPDLTVTTEIAHEMVGRALAKQAAEADLLVVGTHRLSLAERLFTGSLAYQAVAGSPCPVAVVPRLPAEDATRVVVGVDGSEDSRHAVATAAAEAERIGGRLEVVHAWEHPSVYVRVEYLPSAVDPSYQENARVVLAQSVAGLAQSHPDLQVEQVLVQDQPATALLDRAEGAALLVVGSRGLHGIERMLLGSVSHSVVLHAQCPVLVTRP